MTIEVDPDQFARSRFAVSRLAELSSALEVLTHPDRAPYAQRWVRATRRALDRDRIAVLLALVEHQSEYVPDFLVSVPRTYEPTLEQELDIVAQTTADVVRAQLRKAFGTRPLPPAVDMVLGGGESALVTQVVDELRWCWLATMDDDWAALRRVLDDDVRQRATRAGRHGLVRVWDELHPTLGWDGSRLSIRNPIDLTLPATDGVVLTPSVFLHRAALWVGPANHPMVGYPSRGRGQVWATPATNSDGSVLGLRRTALLADLGIARSTTELANRHQVSAATVSYHLDRLHRAGLVTRERDGHHMLYTRTPNAEAILTALDTATG